MPVYYSWGVVYIYFTFTLHNVAKWGCFTGHCADTQQIKHIYCFHIPPLPYFYNEKFPVPGLTVLYSQILCFQCNYWEVQTRMKKKKKHRLSFGTRVQIASGHLFGQSHPASSLHAPWLHKNVNTVRHTCMVTCRFSNWRCQSGMQI